LSATPQAIAGTDLFALFPSPLWELRLGAASRAAMAQAVDEAVARGAMDGPGRDAGAARGTAGGLHRSEALAPLVQLGPLEVVSCAAEAAAPGVVAPFQATVNAFLAGLYVARAPRECRVDFEDPRGQAHLIAPPRTSSEVPDAPVASVAAPAGTLLVFPAWVRQRVVSPPGEAGHVTLTLGLLFGRFAETVSRPKWKGHKQ
jgi:hypothetical protein